MIKESYISEAEDDDLLYRVAIGIRDTFNRMTNTAVGAPLLSPTTPLLEWARTYLPDYFLLPPSQLHSWLAEQCDKSRSIHGQRINVIGPRFSAKSTVACLAHPLRCALEGTEQLIWIISETRSQACGQLEHIKSELETNELLQFAYPRASGRGPMWRVDRIRLNNGVGIEAYGIGQKLRGRRQRARRPTLIICDDMQSDAVMFSPDKRTKDQNWFSSVLLKAGESGTSILNLCTALHRDAIGGLLCRKPGWNSHIFSSIIHYPSNMELWQKWESIYYDVENPLHRENAEAFFAAHRAAMSDGAEVLWPDQESLYALMLMRAEDRAAFEREKQGKAINPEQCEWPEEYFADHIWFERWPDNLILKTIALDPSKGRSDKRGDYSAYVQLGIDSNDVLYVQANLARRPIPQMVADGVSLYQGFHPHAFGVESNAWQDLLKPDFAEEFRNQGIVAPDVWELNNTVNKQVRIRRLGGYLSTKRLRFRQNCASTKLLIEQLRDFPLGDHDDGPDALEMAIRLAEQLTTGG